jgi:DNA mismatch repair protein MSH2
MTSTDARDSSGGGNRDSIEIFDLRHASLSPYLGSKYVTSDVSLSAKRIAIITGPNMGGKSTYLRALGQCVILAHIGSYVPASKASIKIVDSIFARVGASDSLDAGVSTFMAEMLEMSHILRSCTSNSLLLIDELGRGTSTEEGFGIAYAIVEKLARDIKPFVALATHFHELTYIENAYDNIQNVHVDTAITSTTSSKSASIPSICMLYKVVPGVSYSSFGINVAKLAGFPTSIISEAESLLNVLDEHTDIRRGAWEGSQGSASVNDEVETQGVSKKRREA